MSVHSLLSYALAVPDLAADRRFYTTFGLVPAERDGVLALCCDGRGQDQVLLVEGRRKRLHHRRFGSDTAGPAAIRARMRERGVPQIDAPHRAFTGGRRLRDPDGHAVNIRAELPQPRRAAPPLVLNYSGHYDRIATALALGLVIVVSVPRPQGLVGPSRELAR